MFGCSTEFGRILKLFESEKDHLKRLMIKL